MKGRGGGVRQVRPDGWELTGRVLLGVQKVQSPEAVPSTTSQSPGKGATVHVWVLGAQGPLCPGEPESWQFTAISP